MKYRRSTLIIATLAFISTCIGLNGHSSSAYALSGKDFNRTNIVDDTVYFDEGTMSVSKIQAFLNAKVPSCDTNGSKPYGGTTRKAYAASKGVKTPFTCLKNYSQSYSSRAADAYCGAIGGGTKSAAAIIYDVARECGINPQVLLVVLQKEQSLVTDDWPWPIQYRSATGYGCPDTAPCSSQYYGFFNQVYNTARQSKRYVIQADQFNYEAGRTSYVGYNPNASCGGTNIAVQNNATAVLYNYTPYQPNAAALNNLYGTGNSCSAYGNRNFWRMFNDWFGPTTGSYLVRTTSSNTVYLLSDNKKYPISDGATVSALYPLGKSIKYVSSSYLASKTTQPTLKRLIKGSGSSLYFFDAGIKLAFASCSAVEDYGMTCGDYSQLSDLQVSKFANGPTMPLVMNTTSGKWFYMDGGQKREASSIQALTDNGIATTSVRLNESSLADLSLGSPLVVGNSIINDRINKNKYLYSGINRYQVPASLKNLSFFNNMKNGYLDTASINKISSTSFNGYISNGSQRYLLGNGGKILLQTPTDWTDTYTSLPTGLITAIPNSLGSTGADRVYQGSSASIYRINNKKKMPFPGWTDLVLYSNNSPSITHIQDYYLNGISNGNYQYGPSRLVKSTGSNTVYMIDGKSSKRVVASMSVVRAAGVGGRVLIAPQSVLDGYTTSGNIDHRVKCGSSYYLAAGGLLRQIDTSMRSRYGFSDNTFLEYQPETCAVLPKSQAAYTYTYIRASGESTIYYVDSGQKRPFSSYSSYIAHGGNNQNTAIIEKTLSSSIVTGTNL